jgi:glycosyltransferase involved in cell wall biosynthesis
VKDFSIVIAHREVNTLDCKCGEKVHNGACSGPMGLWTTLHSIESDLEDSSFDYDYSIYLNGVGKKLHPDTFNLLYYLGAQKKLTYKETSSAPVSAPTARQTAVEHCDGKYIFFFDNHIIVKPGYFKRAIEMMERYDMDMLHSTARFFAGQPDTYHYCLHLERNFWAEAAMADRATSLTDPYRIAAGGHGGFVVRRKLWEEIGGYWSGFEGYGGEEMYFDLKAALLDKKNWIDPKLIHYHYAGNRGYFRHYSDDFFINMMSCANIIGGQKWLDIVQGSFACNYFKVRTGASIFELGMQAYERSRDHAKWLDGIRKRSLDEQLALFKEQHIAH